MFPDWWGHKQVSKLLFYSIFLPAVVRKVQLFFIMQFLSMFVFLFEQAKLRSMNIMGGKNERGSACSNNRPNTSYLYLLSTTSRRAVMISDLTSTFLSKVWYHKHISLLPKPCHVGIHLKALAEYYQLNTNVPGFQLFLNFFQIILFCPDQPPAAQGLILSIYFKHEYTG